MSDVIPPFGRAVLDALRDLPGGAEAIEREFLGHASRSLPVVTIIGPYDSGKSSFIKRALVDDRRDVPSWLTISARRETFEVGECEAFGCVLRDTPGLSAGSAEHEQEAFGALALTDAIVVVLQPQLLGSGAGPVLDVLSGRLFATNGVVYPPSSLHVVVSRMDEAGPDPAEDPEGYADLAGRKLVELREILTRQRLDPSAIRFHTICADPLQKTLRIPKPKRSAFDDSRSWDGVSALEEELSGLAESLPVLRARAAERYFALMARKALETVEDDLERQQLAAETCQGDIERVTLLEAQLDALSKSARAGLDGVVEQEILSATRMSGLSLADIVQETEQSLKNALARWQRDNDVAITKLAREAGEEHATRKGSPARRLLDDLLRDSGEHPNRRTRNGFVDGLRRFGPHITEALRTLHEIVLGLSLKEARTELARVNALGSFESYVKGAGTRRLVRDPAHAESLDFAVRVHGAIKAVGPLLLELASLYAEAQQERRAALDHDQRLDVLRTRLAEAARSIADDQWQEWEQRVTAFRDRLDEQRQPFARLAPKLAEIVERLGKVHERLVVLTEMEFAQVEPAAGPPNDRVPHEVAVKHRPISRTPVGGKEPSPADPGDQRSTPSRSSPGSKSSLFFLMNRWQSTGGGIQTVNREVACACAARFPEIDCVAVVTVASEAEHAAAKSRGVRLIAGSTKDDWTSAVLSSELAAVDARSVLAVVGHSHFSGAEAKMLRDRFFKAARCVHFVHMSPLDTEVVKEYKTDTYVREREEKLAKEVALASQSDLVLCMGPLLRRYMRDQLIARQSATRVERVDGGFTQSSVNRKPPERPTLLCLGRTQSLRVKGLDLFALAAGYLAAEWAAHPSTRERPPPVFVVRGADTEPEALERQLHEIAKTAAAGEATIQVRRYTTDAAELRSDYLGASVFVMPSRAEGYGLVACEALSLGVPTLLSSRSGLAEVVREITTPLHMKTDSCIVEHSGGDHEIAGRYADAALKILLAQDDAASYTQKLLECLLPTCSWDASAAALVSLIRADPAPR